jgi:hypothetical protein
MRPLFPHLCPALVVLLLALPSGSLALRAVAMRRRSVQPRLAAAHACTAASGSAVATGLRTRQPLASAAPQPARPPYLLTGALRPEWRGTMMGWLHRTRLWYLLAALYVGLTHRLSATSPAPLGACGLSLRVIAAAASSANVYISDGYHNADRRRRRPMQYTKEAETFWLRCDYVGISSVLTSLLWLWSSNMGWPGRMRAVAVASGLSTATIVYLAKEVVPRPRGHSLVKALMALQFVGMLGYLVRLACTVVPPACATSAVIFWIYAPGLALYVLKWPRWQSFGFHEMFHTSVLGGHAASMLCDLGDILAPCARGACTPLIPLLEL